MGEIPHSEKMFHLPIEVSVYVPSTQDVDKVVSKTEMTSRINEVKKYLATLFGGFSSAPVEGGFLASDKKVVKEDVERVNSFASKEDFDKNKEALVQKASEWAREWGQEAIGLEHEGDLYYVPQKFENGGTIAIREAKEMANSQAIELKHHASELANVLKKNPTIEAWVIAKLERASNDLSDVTHYLDGRVQMSGKKMATGGNLSKKMIKVKAVYLEQQYFELTKEMEIPLSVYKEYDKTGKLPLDLQQELCEETSVEHWVETNPIMTILTPVTADKMATGGNTSTPMAVQIKIFDEQETSFISYIRKDEFIFQKISISKNRREEDTTNVFSYKSYDSMLNAAKRMTNDKSTILIYDETGKGEKYLLKDYFNKSAQVDDKMDRGGRLNDNIPSTGELVELVANEREKKIKEWRRMGAKVVVGRNDGYSWEDGTTNDNRETATKPSRAKILEIIKNNPNVTEIHFYGTIKVGQRVGQELEIVDDFDVLLWSKEDNFFKKGFTFEFTRDNGKYKNTIIEKSESIEYKDREDSGEFLYYKSIDKYGNVGQGRIHREVLQEDFDNGDAFGIKKLANGGSIDFDSDDYTLVLYHEEKGNWFIPKGTVYYWLYEDKDAGKKLRDEEYDYVFYPQTSMTLAFQKGYVPPIKRIWTPKFQKQNRGSEKLIGVVQGYINDKGDKLVIEMMSTNPKKQKQGVMSNMIKQLRQQFNLSQEQVEFKDLTKQGESFVSKKKYADGGVIDPNSMEVQFIKYKDEEIMYEPHFKEYYVNDSMFNSLEEAKQFIDGGAPMSSEIKEAYRKGLFKDGGSVGGREGNNSVLKSLFNNRKFTPIKFNGKNVGGMDVTTYRGDTETLRVHMMLILPEFQGKGIGAKAINKLFRDNPNVKQIIGNATAESKSFWQKIGAEFHSNEHTAFTITRNPDIRYDAGGNMEFERPSYQSNYVAGQAQANEIADEKWNMDYENDPLIKAQKKAKEIAKKVKETAKRAAMAYATKGMSETNRQTDGAQGGGSSGMDMSALMKGFKK